VPMDQPVKDRSLGLVAPSMAVRLSTPLDSRLMLIELSDCGSSDAFCGTGCQSDSGDCAVQSALPSPTGAPSSPDGSCGGAAGYSCSGTAFGNCCSQWG
jgi:hypothetical protein